MLGNVGGDVTSFYQIASYYYDEPIVVTAVAPGGPAEKAGLQVGDIILKIDDEPSQELTVLHDYIVENAGKNVTLLIQRDQGEIAFDIIPRISPPEGQGPMGINWQGGIVEGSGGYFPVMAVSCPSE